MAATYNSGLSTEKDWIRFLVGDTNVSSANLSDEEITAFLAATDIDNAAAKRYIAAADLLELLHTRWMTKGHGYASKKLGQLSIAFGTGIGINVDTAVQEKIKQLRIKGAKLLSASIDKPYAFRLMGAVLLGLLLAAPAPGQPNIAGIAARAFPVAATVAQLPAAGSGDHGLRRVTDGASATDCTVGGGSFILLCLDTGAAWTAQGGSGTATDVSCTDCVTLGTETAGGYAASVSEGGPATTATALAANGANCSAGNYPLGVDASGAAESCTADDDVPEAGDFGALALTGDVTSTGLATTIASGAVGLSEIADDALCSGSQAVRRNAGDTAYECYTPAAGGSSSGTGVQAGDGAGGFVETTSTVSGGVITQLNVDNLRLDGNTISVPGDSISLRLQGATPSALFYNQFGSFNATVESDNGDAYVTVDKSGSSQYSGMQFYSAGSRKFYALHFNDDTLHIERDGGSGIVLDTSGNTKITGIFKVSPRASAPATCTAAEDVYTDTSGAICFCSATNTWEQLNAVGSCA